MGLRCPGGSGAPVVLSVAAAGAVAKVGAVARKVGALAIESRRIYEAADEAATRDAAPRRIVTRPESEKPSIRDYADLAAMLDVERGHVISHPGPRSHVLEDTALRFPVHEIRRAHQPIALPQHRNECGPSPGKSTFSSMAA